MKRKYLLTLLLASFFILVTFHGMYVSAAISGDDLCGGASVKYSEDGKTIVSGSCGVDSFVKISQGIFSVIISLGAPLLVIFVIYRFIMAWYALNQGNANAYKEATKKAGQAILGFLVVVAIMGGLLLSILKFLGVNESYFGLLKKISSYQLIERAHALDNQDGCNEKRVGAACLDAYKEIGKCSYNRDNSYYFCLRNGVVMCPEGQMYVNGNTCVDDNKAWADTTAATQRMNESTGGQINSPSSNTTQPPKKEEVSAPSSSGGSLPNPLPGVTSLYDFILAALALVMRFFIYPALIGIWVWTGFLYVWAQGAPERLSKAHKLALWAFMSTLIVFVAQGFLSALRGSVEKVLPKTSQEIRVEREPLAILLKHHS